jgi:hypothetical protein
MDTAPEQVEVDEMEIYTLEQQLVEVKKQLEGSKLRFENARLYDLTA